MCCPQREWSIWEVDGFVTAAQGSSLPTDTVQLLSTVLSYVLPPKRMVDMEIRWFCHGGSGF